jgi:uncharacterized protein YgbK (DUF1537 family)
VERIWLVIKKPVNFVIGAVPKAGVIVQNFGTVSFEQRLVQEGSLA